MSNLQQQDQITGINAANGDSNIFYPKLGGISTITPSQPLTTLADHT